tara:strand:+ start:2707 stop:3843 length:1137 start_codon:yes stop_codon:yes gene_type:complete
MVRLTRFGLIFSYIVTSIVLFIFLVEGVSWISIRMLPMMSGILNERSIKNINIDGRVNSPVYKDKGNARKLFADLIFNIKDVYHPYAVWRNGKVETETLNIDKNGNRKTCYQENLSNDAKKLFIFGGGHVVGEGVEDCDSLPSYLSKVFMENNLNTKVFNYGTGGFASTQEMLRLLTEIHKGNTPDYVIFYDGVNDLINGVYNPGIPGYHMGFNRIQKQFNTSGLIGFYNKSNFARLLEFLDERFNRRDRKIPDVDIKLRVAKSLDIYKKNIEILEVFSKVFDFKYFAFWQPELLTSRKRMSDYEKMQKRTSGRLNSVYEEGYSRIKKIDFNGLNFYNISHIYDKQQEDIFFDFNHVGSSGNALAADEIFAIISDELQ